MEEKSLKLKDFALLCECSGKVNQFGILADFLKRAVMDYYSYKGAGKEMPDEDREVFIKKYNELQEFLKDCELY